MPVTNQPVKPQTPISQPQATAPISTPVANMPEAPVKPRGEPSAWLTEARAFLESRGWTESGNNERGDATWNDPVGSTAKPVKVEAVVLRTKNGGKETIMQSRGAPLPWVYGTDEALSMQRQRDRAKKVA